jgi:hypothetical protein
VSVGSAARSAGGENLSKSRRVAARRASPLHSLGGRARARNTKTAKNAPFLAGAGTALPPSRTGSRQTPAARRSHAHTRQPSSPPPLYPVPCALYMDLPSISPPAFTSGLRSTALAPPTPQPVSQSVSQSVRPVASKDETHSAGSPSQAQTQTLPHVAPPASRAASARPLRPGLWFWLPRAASAGVAAAQSATRVPLRQSRCHLHTQRVAGTGPVSARPAHQCLSSASFLGVWARHSGACPGDA